MTNDIQRMRNEIAQLRTEIQSVNYTRSMANLAHQIESQLPSKNAEVLASIAVRDGYALPDNSGNFSLDALGLKAAVQREIPTIFPEPAPIPPSPKPSLLADKSPTQIFELMRDGKTSFNDLMAELRDL
ncbi:MAG: hypothetical protein F6J89_14415 [Symploca sp. SIO1C4]|uniref:Uncharacterized protein n=1 Tax=Symploca sp. SIO1C4 TaxID=2607765 RepID=A0A6B3N6Q7_9CYAN|nr:hypothetical protein [Symploca sp. SIO1C4]